MNILVVNGSPKGEGSDTLRVTRAFLAGMGEPYALVHTIHSDIRPCLGCYACWHKTPGQCVQRDDVAAILGRLCAADLLIWSTPLYCYSVPSSCKALLDRLLPLSGPKQVVGADGRTHHPVRDRRPGRMLLISGCGFPEREGNFDALIFQFRRMFGQDLPMILCMEAPLLGIEEAAPVAAPYLALAEQAGREFKQTGAITPETQAKLDAPMYPPALYRAQAGGR